MKNKTLMDTYKSGIETILHAILDNAGNCELKIVINDKGYKILKDNEKIDDFYIFNILMSLGGILYLENLDDELMTEQLELFMNLLNKILNLRKEGKDEEKA